LPETGIGISLILKAEMNLIAMSCWTNMVPEAGFEPARPRGRGIFVPLRLSPPPLASRRRSWSGARLHPGLAAV